MSGAKTFIQVGCGGFGNHWLDAVWPRLIQRGAVRAVAAVDINAATHSRACQQLELQPADCYTDLQPAFDAHADADFAVVVVPPAHHESVVDQALARGMHILSEKPIADSMQACCRIYLRVQAAGLKMAVTMSHRFDQDKQTLERLIHSGDYGRLDYLVGRNTWACRRRGQWGQFRYDIPDALLIEGTVHHFDIVRSLARSNARWVHAVSWNPPWSEFRGDPQALILIQMENGVKVQYEGAKTNASTLNGWTRDYWRAECEQATLELDNRVLRLRAELAGPQAPVERALDVQEVWMNPWLAELFVDWLNGGPAPPECPRGQHPLRRPALRRHRIGPLRPGGGRAALSAGPPGRGAEGLSRSRGARVAAARSSRSALRA